MADNDPLKIQIDPPPPPRAMQMLGFAFGIGAGIAGLAGFCKLAGILALGSVALHLADYFMNRGTVEIPRSAMDSEGRLKTTRRTDSANPGT